MEAIKTAPVELSSPELVKLAADLKTSWAKQRAIEDMDSTEFSEAATETLAIKSAIAKEKARLIKEANDQKLAELRNAAKAEFDGMLALRDKAAGKGATEDDKTAATNAYEAIVNKLLPIHKAAAAKGDGSAKTSGSGTKYQQIHDAMTAGNVTYDQLIAQGFGDGTIRTVASEQKFKKNADGTYSPKG